MDQESGVSAWSEILLGVGLGLMSGVMLGAAFNYMNAGIIIGTLLGVVIGVLFSKRNR